MSVQKHIVDIKCDGDSSVGYGHIRRCETLQKALQSFGVDAYISTLRESSRELIGSTKLLKKKPSLVVFDSPYDFEDVLKDARLSGFKTLTLDYFGQSVPDINISIYPHHISRAKYESFVGFDYVMVRSEIIAAKSHSESKITNHNNYILIVIGGGDTLGHGVKAAEFFIKKEFEVILVQGPTTNSADIYGVKSYQVLKNPPNLPALIAGASIVITNGGGTLFEALYLNKNIYVLPQTDRERVIADTIYMKDMILGYGSENLYRIKFKNNNTSNGETLIDGGGANRVCRIILNHLAH